MFGGYSGCFGIVAYNTKLEGNNAVYGYYNGNEICIETGTVDEMKAFKDSQEKECTEKSISAKKVILTFLSFVLIAVAGFISLPLRTALAVALFCLLSYLPVMIIIRAFSGIYENAEERENFRRFHGCEHAVIAALTKGKAASIENLKKERIYDTECGTAYSGYALAVAFVLSALIVFWPGLLRAAGMLVLLVIIILIMILVPAINPFTVFQRPVVQRPTEHEYNLGIEIMKKLRELE